MSRTPIGIATRAAIAVANGCDDDANSYLSELRSMCDSGHRATVGRVYVRALLDQMTTCSFSQAKSLNKLHEQLGLYLPETAVHRLVAKVFAKQAVVETNINRRSRLYKLACRHAPIDVVAAAFEKRGVKVRCPLNRQHPVDRIGAPVKYPFFPQLAKAS